MHPKCACDCGRVVTTVRAACRPVNQLLESYREERHGPTVVVLQVSVA